MPFGLSAIGWLMEPAIARNRRKCTGDWPVHFRRFRAIAGSMSHPVAERPLGIADTSRHVETRCCWVRSISLVAGWRTGLALGSPQASQNSKKLYKVVTESSVPCQN